MTTKKTHIPSFGPRALLGVLCFLALQSYAQDTLIELPEVELREWKVEESQMLLQEGLLMAAPHRNVADHLQRQQGFYIRSQGNTVLNSASYKGLGSMHIPVLVGGYSIQSSMNGTLDLSLLSAFHFDRSHLDEYDIKRNALPNLGPEIHLDQSIRDRLDVSISANTMNNGAAGIRFGRLGRKHKLSVSLHGSRGDNNYSLEHYPYGSGRLEHSGFQKLDGLVKWEWGSARGWNNAFTAYGIGAARLLPSNSFIRSSAEQGDRLYSIGDRLSRTWGDHLIAMDLHMLLERIDFQSDPASERYVSRARTHNNGVSYRYKPNAWSFTSHLLHSRALYYSNALVQDVQWDRVQWANSVGLDTNNWSMSALFTIVASNDDELQPLLDLKVGKKLGKHRWSVQWQKVYRLPNLNERFWYQPGYAYGDSALRPEQGHRIDLYYQWRTDRFRIKLNPFTGWYSDMIRWIGVPVRASNVQSVWSRGVDLGTTWSIPLSKAVLILDQHLHAVKATYDERNGISPYGKQLAYTPLLSGNLTTSLRFERWGCYINQQAVGRNYITSDNSEWLDPYYLLEFGGHYSLRNWRIGLLLSNALNAAYHTEPYRPLPGRQFHLNITYLTK